MVAVAGGYGRLFYITDGMMKVRHFADTGPVVGALPVNNSYRLNDPAISFRS